MKQNNNMKTRAKKKYKTKYKMEPLKEENRRMMILFIFVLIFFSLIIFRILYLNIFMANYYDMKLNKMSDNYVYGESVPRGRILDRNGKLLAYNKAVKSIYYKRPSGVSTEDEVKTAYDISKILSLDYNSILTRNLKEFYILINKDYTDKLITDEEYEKLENRKLTEDEIYELKIDRITKKDLKTMSKEDKKAAYVYYLMNKGYFYEEKEIKVKNVTDKEYAYFSENSKKLNGFYSKLEWERVYPYKDTLGIILGSVSSKKSGIPKEEAKEYLEKGYNLNDRVGISGLEKYYENILRGEKAIYKLGDDGKLTLVKEGKKGTDIMLSIDIDLQLKIDKMLERELIRAKSEANTQYFNRSYVIIENPITQLIHKIIIKKKGRKIC